MKILRKASLGSKFTSSYKKECNCQGNFVWPSIAIKIAAF